MVLYHHMGTEHMWKICPVDLPHQDSTGCGHYRFWTDQNYFCVITSFDMFSNEQLIWWRSDWFILKQDLQCCYRSTAWEYSCPLYKPEAGFGIFAHYFAVYASLDISVLFYCSLEARHFLRFGVVFVWFGLAFMFLGFGDIFRPVCFYCWKFLSYVLGPSTEGLSCMIAHKYFVMLESGK